MLSVAISASWSYRGTTSQPEFKSPVWHGNNILDDPSGMEYFERFFEVIKSMKLITKLWKSVLFNNCSENKRRT